MGKNNKTIIVNMMMMMTHLEYIATEDLATAKSSVAISSAHHDDDYGDDDDYTGDGEPSFILVMLMIMERVQ